MSDLESFEATLKNSISMREAWAIRDEWAKRAQSEIDRLTRELAERETQLASIRQLLEDAEARAGSANASLPDGWVAVPVEPTVVQLNAGVDADDLRTGFETVKVIYRAMLSARPDPKESSDVE